MKKIGNVMDSHFKKSQFIKPIAFKDLPTEKGCILTIATDLNAEFLLKPSVEKIALISQRMGISPQNITKGFANLRSNYNLLFDYFTGKEGGLDLNKSLFVYGNTGCGKTFSMKVFKNYTSERLRKNSFVTHPMTDIIARLQQDGLGAVDSYIRLDSRPISLYIEDFGNGKKDIKNYGTDINPIDELMDKRYRLWEDTNYHTHVCSNIMWEDLDNHFSERVVSRMRRMYQPINFSNIDFRKI